jgi:hypothetical protein
MDAHAENLFIWVHLAADGRSGPRFLPDGRSLPHETPYAACQPEPSRAFRGSLIVLTRTVYRSNSREAPANFVGMNSSLAGGTDPTFLDCRLTLPSTACAKRYQGLYTTGSLANHLPLVKGR